jgi:hypothetical protein
MSGSTVTNGEYRRRNPDDRYDRHRRLMEIGSWGAFRRGDDRPMALQGPWKATGAMPRSRSYDLTSAPMRPTWAILGAFVKIGLAGVLGTFGALRQRVRPVMRVTMSFQVERCSSSS